MIVEIKVPSPGESISEVEIANWLVTDMAEAWLGREQNGAERVTLLS